MNNGARDSMTFDDWFLRFWSMYDKKYTDNCSPKKGSKAKAKRAAKNCLKRALKDRHCATDEDFYTLANNALSAQKKYWDDAQRLKKWMPNFPHVSTWFNDDRWDIDLDSHAELREVKDGTPRPKVWKGSNSGKVTDINKARQHADQLKRMLK